MDEKESFEKLKQWINSNECDCELELETYAKCCGKDMDFLTAIHEFCSKERIRPRFMDLDIQKQKEILDFVIKYQME